eukprot:1209403-Pyramimonas_sp.AAC.1
MSSFALAGLSGCSSGHSAQFSVAVFGEFMGQDGGSEALRVFDDGAAILERCETPSTRSRMGLSWRTF